MSGVKQKQTSPVGKTGARPVTTRKLNLNLPSNYKVETPEERLNRIIKEGVPGAARRVPSASSMTSSQLASVLKKASNLPTKIDIRRRHGRVEITTKGATVELNPSAEKTIGGTVEYGGKVGGHVTTRHGDGLKSKVSTAIGQPLRLETSYRDLKVTITFSSSDSKTMAFDRWEYRVTWGSTAPNLSSLKTVFSNGANGLRGAVGSLGKLKSIQDVSKVKDAMKPHFEPISKAVEAAGKIAKTSKGVSLSFTASGPLHKGAGNDWKVMAMVTIRF